MITREEVKSRLKWLFLAISSFYLVFPIRSILDKIFFKVSLPEHVYGQLIIGIILTTIAMAIFDD